MKDLGKKLKDMRIEKGITQAEVSDKTKLSLTIIEALENGDLNPFSEDLTYVKYYVRSYCKAIDFDFDEIASELDQAIVGYTQAITVLEEERKEEITRQIEEKKATIKTQSKKSKSGLKHRSGHLDWTLISLVSIVAIVFAFVIYAVFVKGIAKKEQPVEQSPVVEKDPQETTTEPEDKEPVPEEKVNPVKIEKIDPNTYEIYNWNDEKEFSIGIDFNVDTWILVNKNDVPLADPESRVYLKGESLSINKELNENDRFTIIFGIVKSNEIKINNETYVLDDAIKDTPGRAEVTFILMGEKES